MSEETKIKLFEKVLQYEHLLEQYPNTPYFDRVGAAFEMLEIMGLGSEYIKWSIGK